MEILEIIWDFLNPQHDHVDIAIAPVVGAALIGGAVQLIGGIFGSRKARKQRRAAQRRINALNKEAAMIKSRRPEIIDPFASTVNVSNLAKDLSGMISNPYSNLGVATQAAEIQIEQSDIALANTLDTLRSTGASAGGATALAQAALQSKKNVAASIEKQEAQNEKLKAQGEARAQQQVVAEKQRMQGIEISEAQRVQAADAAGKQFVFAAEENRVQQDLNNVYSQLQGQQGVAAQASAAQTSMMGSTMQGLASIGGSLISSGALSGGGMGASPTAQNTFNQASNFQAPAISTSPNLGFSGFGGGNTGMYGISLTGN